MIPFLWCENNRQCVTVIFCILSQGLGTVDQGGEYNFKSSLKIARVKKNRRNCTCHNITMSCYPAITTPNAGSMLGHRPRRWPNIDSALGVCWGILYCKNYVVLYLIGISKRHQLCKASKHNRLKGVVHSVPEVGKICSQKAPRGLHSCSRMGNNYNQTQA